MRAEIRGRGLQRSHLSEIIPSFRGKRGWADVSDLSAELAPVGGDVQAGAGRRGTFRSAPGGGCSRQDRRGRLRFVAVPDGAEARVQTVAAGGGMGVAAKPEPTIGPAGAAAVRTAWLSGTRMLHEGVACRFVSLRALDGSFAQPHAIDGAETVLRRRPLHVSGRRPRFPSERNVLWNFPSFPAA